MWRDFHICVEQITNNNRYMEHLRDGNINALICPEKIAYK